MPVIYSLSYEDAMKLASLPLDYLTPEQEASLDSFVSSLPYEESLSFMWESDFRRSISRFSYR